jgi:hypothetical protein
MLNCNLCNGVVSKNAKACPHCGEPRNPKPIRSAVDVIFVFALAVVAIFLAFRAEIRL